MTFPKRDLRDWSVGLAAAAALSIAASQSLAGQVGVTNPGGIIGILSPPQEAAPPAIAGTTLPGTTSPDPTSTIGNGPETFTAGGPILSPRQSGLARQLQLTGLDSISTADLRTILAAIDARLVALPGDHPMLSLLTGERARIIGALSLR